MVVDWITAEPLVALGDVIARLERAWYAPTKWDSDVLHPYTGWPVAAFIPALRAAIKASPRRDPRFLDVGCGIGTKMLIAARLGCLVHGIDVRDQYLGAARQLCPEGTFETSDARGYYGYGNFDIVYCYRPLIREDDQLSLDAEIATSMRRESILILVDRVPPGDWEPVARDVWRAA